MSFDPSLLAKFGTQNQYQCPQCMLQNDKKAPKCRACDHPNPNYQHQDNKDKDDNKGTTTTTSSTSNGSSGGGIFQGLTLGSSTGNQGSGGFNLFSTPSNNSNAMTPQSLFPPNGGGGDGGNVNVKTNGNTTGSAQTPVGLTFSATTPLQSSTSNVVNGTGENNQGIFQTPAVGSSNAVPPQSQPTGDNTVTATPAGDSLFQPTENAVRINPSDNKPIDDEEVGYFDPLPSDPFKDPAQVKPVDIPLYKTIKEGTEQKLGSVYTFGTGDCEQLGHTDGEMTIFRPARIESLVEQGIYFVRVVAGGLHNLALTKDGRVWSWGCNDDCVLGRDGDENTPLPVENLEGVHIVSISAGDCHSAAVDTDGNVWIWGTYKGKNGYLGFSSGAKKQELPAKIADVRRYGKAVAVSSGEQHTAVLLDNGKAVVWGFSEEGQLGRAPFMQELRGNRSNYRALQPVILKAYDPDLIRNAPCDAFTTPNKKTAQKKRGRVKNSEEKFTSVHCVGNSTYMICQSGRIFACGLNNYGQLGTGDRVSRFEPTEISSLRGKGEGPFKVSGGTHHSLVLCRDGSVYAMGRGDSGQLGVSRSSSDKAPAGSATLAPLRIPQQFFGGSRVLQVEAGGCFSLCFTADNQVYAWGYGEMGQLGNAKSNDIDTIPDDEVVPFNVTKAGGELEGNDVLQLGAGGQHSVILVQDGDARSSELNSRSSKVKRSRSDASSSKDPNEATGKEPRKRARR